MSLQECGGPARLKMRRTVRHVHSGRRLAGGDVCRETLWRYRAMISVLNDTLLAIDFIRASAARQL